MAAYYALDTLEVSCIYYAYTMRRLTHSVEKQFERIDKTYQNTDYR